MADISSRVALLHRQLIEETERSTVARIHLELGEIAVGEGRFPQANRHFREALWWDPSLDAARSALLTLGEWVDRKATAHRGGGVLRFLMDQIRRPTRTVPV